MQTPVCVPGNHFSSGTVRDATLAQATVGRSAIGIQKGAGLGGIDGLSAGDPVTAEQMRALFGCGLHPLAELRQQQLEGPDLTLRDFQNAARLGAPQDR